MSLLLAMGSHIVLVMVWLLSMSLMYALRRRKDDAS